MSVESKPGFGPVLASRPFRALWIAQALAQTAQHAIHFVQMVLVEELTGSSTQIGLVILSFTLPGVLFSSVAGVLVDRWPKRLVLVGSNALRVLLVSSYLLVLGAFQGWGLLLGIYVITFISSSVGQFFAPTQAATIPLLVGEEQLLAANSLFNLTLAISQVVGLIVIGPLATKLMGTSGAFVTIAVMYLGATLAVTRLPRIEAPRASAVAVASLSRWERTRAELSEGWRFVLKSRRVLLALAHLALVSTVIMIMSMLAPGFASRVLGMQPEDAVFVFAPAGVGMLLSTALLGRFGYRMRKEWASNAGLVLMGLAFAALGLVSQGYRILPEPLLDLYPQAALSLTTTVMGISLVLGLTMSGISILGQTMLQEDSPPEVRGRVFAVQFMLSSLIGIPPMLTLGGLADVLGIPQVMLIMGVAVMLASGVSIYLTLSPERRSALRDFPRRAVAAVRSPGDWLLRPPWIDRLVLRVRRGVRWCVKAWQSVRRTACGLVSALGLKRQAAQPNPAAADTQSAGEGDGHEEGSTRSVPEQLSEDGRD
ncbi:MAG TPA: MFS transporter [Anaerolineae bacterium]|nr:MFS transporter [Anaerolineae bacterium]